MGSDGVEDLRRHTVATSQNGWVEVWKKSCGIVLNGENVCEMLHRRLIIIPGGTKKMKNVVI